MRNIVQNHDSCLKYILVLHGTVSLETVKILIHALKRILVLQPSRLGGTENTIAGLTHSNLDPGQECTGCQRRLEEL